MKKDLEEINWLEDRLYGLSKIIERSIEGNWTGIKHNEWLEEVRDIIEQICREERERVLNKIKLEKQKSGWENADFGPEGPDDNTVDRKLNKTMPKKENTKKEFQEIKELLKEILEKLNKLRIGKIEYHYHFEGPSRKEIQISSEWMTGTKIDDIATIW